MSNCPICNSPSLRLRTFAQRKAEELELRLCQKCNQEFLHPYPSDEWLSEEYSQYFAKRQAGLSRAKKFYFQKLFHNLGYNFKDKSILEFGPGEGDAISALREVSLPKAITVVERNQEADVLLSELECTHYNMFLEEYLDTDPDEKKYDFIFLFDVLEHLKNPLKAVQDLKNKKLNKDGFIIASLPVADSLSRKILGAHWPQYKVEHLNYFTDKSLREMGRLSGLRLVKNEVLFKNLSLDYLLNVGKGFGPGSFQKVSSLISEITPIKLRAKNLNFGYGEKIVVYQI